MLIIRLLVLIILLTNTALASRSGFYIKPIFSKFQPDNINKMSSNNIYSPGFAIGYNFKDNVRSDLSLEHFSHIKHSFTLHCLPSTREGDLNLDSHNVLCEHRTITTIKANLFVDIIKIKNASLYLGSGIGVARIKGEGTFSTYKSKIKTNYHMAYSIYSGISHKVSENIFIEFGYNYKHLTESFVNYKGHGISTSVRVDL